MQLAGFAKRYTLFATVYVRAVTQLAAQRVVSSAVIFVDIKSAFHSMIREIVFGGSTMLHPKLQHVLEAAGLDADALSGRVASASDPTLPKLPCPVRRLICDAHQCTWFTLGASGEVQGSRPGSPLADVAFNSLMALVMREMLASAIRICGARHPCFAC